MSHRLLLPLVLIALGIWAAAGCIYIPSTGAVVNGTNAAKSVGGEKSSKPIRVMHATRFDVLRVLGKPNSSSSNALTYTWSVDGGRTVYLLCGFATTDKIDGHNLLLYFDERGTLTNFEITKQEGKMPPLF